MRAGTSESNVRYCLRHACEEGPRRGSPLSASGGPFDEVPADDPGGDTFARYRYQAHVAFEPCLDCALGAGVLRVAIEHFSDLVIESEAGFRFIEIKTSDEGSWTAKRMLETGAVDALWRSYCVDEELEATYEVFLEGSASPRDPLAKLAATRLTPEVRAACAARLSKRDPAPDPDSLGRFLSRLRVRLDLPNRGDIWRTNLALVGEALPKLSTEETTEIRERIMERIEAAMDAPSGVNEWRELLLRGDAADPALLRRRSKIVEREDLSPVFEVFRGMALPRATREELRQLFAELRTVGLDQCVTFRPESLPVEDIEDFCLPVQVMAEEALLKLESRRALERSQAGEDPEHLLSTHESLHFDGSARVTIESMNSALTRPGNVVVRGEPGEGKTTGLWLYAAASYGVLEARLATGAPADDVVVPLLLSLRDVPAPGEPAPPLAEILVDKTLARRTGLRRRSDVLRRYLDERITKGRVEICLDALDELPPGREAWLRDELATLRDVRVILTTRPSAEDRVLILRDPVRFRVVCFGRNQAAEYVRRFFERSRDGVTRAGDLLRHLDESASLRALMQIPLLLAISCEARATDDNEPFPGTRGGLLALGIRRMMRREELRGGRGRDRSRQRAKESALAALGWRFLERRPLPFDEDQALDALQAVIATDTTRILSPYRAQDLWDGLVRDGIIALRGQRRFSFVLRSFHELAAAQELARRLAGMDAAKIRSDEGIARDRNAGSDFDPSDAPGWREIWPLAAGLLSDPLPLCEALEETRRSAEDRLASRAILAAQAFGEARSHLGASKRGMELVASCRDVLLARLLRGDLPEAERSELAIALGVLPGDAGQVALVALLEDDSASPSSRELAADALGWIGGTAARDALVRMAMLEDPALESLRGQSVVSLGRVGGEHAALAVHDLWSRRLPQRVRVACMVTLAALADARSLELLLSTMRDDDEDAELRSLALLETSRHGLDVGVEWARAVLARPLGPGEEPARAWRLREACAMALGELRDLASIPVLGRLGRDESTPEAVWMECVESLGEIGTREARDELRSFRVDGPRALPVACALGHLGEDARPFVDLLEDHLARVRAPSSVRIAVAEALGGIEGGASEGALLERLADADEPTPDVQTAVLKILGRRRGSKKERQRRQEHAGRLLTSRHARVQVEAALYLTAQADRGDDASEAVIRTLAQNLDDAALGNAVRSRALDALALFDDERARALIARVLAGKDDWMARHALVAAATQARVFGRRLLETGGWSGQSN